MKKKTTILTVAAALLILLGGGYYFFWSDEDEKIINRNLDRIVELSEKERNESLFVTIGQSRDILRYIAPQPEVDLGAPLPLITDRNELEGVIIQIRQSLQSLTIRIVRNELTIADDGLTARMELEAEGNAAYSGEAGIERRKFSIGWVKEEGDWLVQTVRHEGPLFR